jgi:uncharacterized MAPEG superfamily protein
VQDYAASVIGLLVLGAVPVVMAGISGPAKAKAGVPSGPVADARDENRVYRIERVHMNAVETLPVFAVPAILAMLVGLNPVLLAVLVWLNVALRLVYTAVYLRGGPLAKGGSLRSVLFVAGSGATSVLALCVLWRVLVGGA